RKRFIDIEIKFTSGVRWLFEVKVDPAYQDRDQIIEEAGLLTEDDRLIIIAPNDLTSFVSTSLGDHPNRNRVHCLTWRVVGHICAWSPMKGFPSLRSPE